MRPYLPAIALLVLTATPPVLAQQSTPSPYDSRTVQSLGTVSANEAVGLEPALDQAPPDNLPPLSEAAYASTPIEQTVGAVRYVTGGVGDEEKSWFDSHRSGYNLHIVNAAHGGHYMGDLTLRLLDSQGTELLNANNVGPIFYASLPPGGYQLELQSREGQTQRQPVKLNRGGNRNLVFTW